MSFLRSLADLGRCRSTSRRIWRRPRAGRPLYFLALWRSARLFVGGGSALAAIALALGRFVLLGGALTLASFEGARLLALAVGVLIARAAVVRRVGRRAS